jgi:hypothetical protein
MSTDIKIALTLACLIWVIPSHFERFRSFLVNAYEVEFTTEVGVISKNVLPGGLSEEEEDEVTEEVTGEVEVESTEQKVSSAFPLVSGNAPCSDVSLQCRFARWGPLSASRLQKK